MAPSIVHLLHKGGEQMNMSCHGALLEVGDKACIGQAVVFMPNTKNYTAYAWHYSIHV